MLIFKKFHHAKFEKSGDYHWFQWELRSSFGVWLLINCMVNVTETFTNILKHYFLQMNAVKFAKCVL